jgi:uncharacterized protein YndB with AHSA1/START domain
MSDDRDTTRGHQHQLEIEASPEEVWKAITESEQLVNWFPLEAEVHPGPGGSIRYAWGELAGVSSIEAWEPPRRLRTGWMGGTAPGDEGDEERRRVAVDWFLEGRGGRTVLRLVHSGFGRAAAWDEEFDGTRRGWDFELRSLKHYLEHHRGEARRALWLRVPIRRSVQETWDRLTVPGGLVREGELRTIQAGDRYRIALSTGDVLEGVVRILRPPQDFAGTVENLGNSLFRLAVENCGGGPEAALWLSTWGRPPAETAAIEGRWRQALERAV